MRKKFRTLVVMLVIIIGLTSSSILIHSNQPPQGYTGAGGLYCTSCHNTNPLNSPGGSVTATGLPGNNYTPGTAYDFSITTTHSAANRRRWGFSIIAVNSQGQPVGAFSTSNPNAAINGDELSHFNATVSATLQQSFTYNNLTWTAPQNPTVADQNITFYFTGNAASGSGSSGDYIYADTISVSLLQVSQVYTFTGNGNWGDPANWSNNTIPPSTITGNASIIIDPAAGGECVLNGAQHIGAGATVIVKEGKNLRLAGGLIINNQ